MNHDKRRRARLIKHAKSIAPRRFHLLFWNALALREAAKHTHQTDKPPPAQSQNLTKT